LVNETIGMVAKVSDGRTARTHASRAPVDHTRRRHGRTTSSYTTTTVHQSCWDPPRCPPDNPSPSRVINRYEPPTAQRN